MRLNDSALDFRAFIAELRRRNDLVDVNVEVDADLEIGAITRRVYEERRPAPLFNRIKSGMAGARILGAPAGLGSTRDREFGRLALHFGLPQTAGPRDIVEKIRATMKQPPLPPRKVETGPVKENIWLGDDVDLTKLPVPLLHEKDGGRYLGTYGFHVVQSPDGKWDSWSISRTMLLDRNRMTGLAIPTQHFGKIRQMWSNQGKPLPWAMVLGAPPAALAVAGMPLPDFVSEPGYVGALVGEPVHVVKTETNNLWVPANAEIVLEGELSLTETALEGPMGEYHGYQFLEGHQQPVFHVRAMTFRNDPILPICVAGTPPEENHTIWGTMISAQLLDALQQAGLPVDMAWCSYEAASCWAVLSIDVKKLAERRTAAKEFAADVAKAFFGSRVGRFIPKVILVSNDIDITDINAVVWAIATRSHPLHDHFIFPDIKAFPLVPYLNADDKARGSGGRVVMNCLFPEQFQGEIRATTASFSHSYPDSVKDLVNRRWNDYGFAA